MPVSTNRLGVLIRPSLAGERPDDRRPLPLLRGEEAREARPGRLADELLVTDHHVDPGVFTSDFHDTRPIDVYKSKHRVYVQLMPPRSPKRAVIYTRISDDREGREYGVQRQEEDCRALADRAGYTVIEVFTENDVSASSKSRKPRPRYRAMLELARSGGCDVIISFSSSRLTRRPMEFEELIQLHEETKIAIELVGGRNDLSTARGRRHARDDASRDAEEAETTGERVARAARQRAEKGLWNGGPFAPAGYRFGPQAAAGGKILEIDPDKAELIREAARRLLARETLYGICQDWNRRGESTSTGKRWAPPNLRRAVERPAVAGLTEVKGAEHDVFHDAQWPAILDRDIWDRVRAVFGADGRKFRGTPGPFGQVALGKGVTVCKVCGQRLIASKYGEDRRRLFCSTQNTGGCGSVTIDYTWFEAHVFAAMATHVATEEFAAALDRRKQASPEDKIRDLHAQLRSIDAERERIRTSFEKGWRTESETDFEMTRLTELEAKTRQALDEAARSQDAVWWDHNNIHEVWEKADISQRRALAESLVVKIEVGQHPKGVARGTPHRRGTEDETSFALRLGAHWFAVMEARVTIHWRHAPADNKLVAYHFVDAEVLRAHQQATEPKSTRRRSSRAD